MEFNNHTLHAHFNTMITPTSASPAVTQSLTAAAATLVELQPSVTEPKDWDHTIRNTRVSYEGEEIERAEGMT